MRIVGDLDVGGSRRQWPGLKAIAFALFIGQNHRRVSQGPKLSEWRLSVPKPINEVSLVETLR
jgi:hypothetical protein